MDGIETALDAVRSWFDARGGGVECTFGFDAADRFQENTAARCAFIPGDPSRIMCGTSNEVDSFRDAPDAQRSFALINERFQIVISAFDASDPTDQLVQYRAVKLLHRRVREALFASEYVLFITRVDWITGTKLFSHGFALRLVCEAHEYQTVSEPGDINVFPWTALTRVYNNEVFVESIESPPLED